MKEEVEVPKIGGNEIGWDLTEPTVGGLDGGDPDLLLIRRTTEDCDLKKTRIVKTRSKDCNWRFG